MHPALAAFVRGEVAAEKRRQVKDWAISAAASSALSFSVSEVRCSDPRCADVETFVLVMAEGCATRRARIPLPLVEVTRAHVIEALAAVLTSSASSGDPGDPS